LLLMYGRYYLDTLGAALAGVVSATAFKAAAQSAMLLVAVMAGMVLIMLARQPWREMGDADAPTGGALAAPA